MRAVHVTVQAIESKVHEVRAGDQQTTARHQHAVQDDRVVFGKGDAHHQQRQAGKSQPQRERSMMAAVTVDQRKQRQRTGAQHEAALERMIGQEAEPKQGENGQYKWQQGAVDRAKERGGRTDAIG